MTPKETGGTQIAPVPLPVAPAADQVEAFIGSADSGDPGWAGRGSRQLRTEAAVRRAGQRG